jgi:thymidylate kinase
MTPEDEALLARVPPDRREVNGLPPPDLAEGRARGVELVREVLDGDLQPNGIRISPLGPEWSTDIDAHVGRRPDPRELKDQGWVELDGLLHKLGSHGAGRWAVTEGGRVLAGVDLHLFPPYRPVGGIVARCRRRGEVRVREVLELRTLLREGHELAPSEVIDLAARVEAGLGGSELATFRRRDPVSAPAPLPRAQIKAKLVRFKPRRRRRVAVAISGVDGAGKSTLVRALQEDLEAAGVPVATVWTRPGLDLKLLERVARVAKRVLGQKPSPGIRDAAQGRAGDLRSRRGAVGWAWSLLVTTAFLRRVRRDFRRLRGVVLFDRHLADALATLEFAYEGVNLTVHRALVRRLLPPAALTVFLHVDVDTAVARKPGDVIGTHAVARQLEVYESVLDEVRGVVKLDSGRPPEELSFQVFKALAEL